MKTYRQVVLLVYCAAVCVVCVYPPWKVSLGTLRHNSRYSLLWTPPWVYENGEPYDAIVDLARVGLELIAVTALAGFLLLLGEVGQWLKPTVSLPAWITKKVIWSVLAGSILAYGTLTGTLTLYRYHHEQLRLRQIVEQKATCDKLWKQCQASDERKAAQERKEGKQKLLTLGEWLDSPLCGEDSTVEQEYWDCQGKVQALQTEQERQRDEQQQHEPALSSERPLLSLPEDKEQ